MLTPDRPATRGYAICELKQCAEREVRRRRQRYPNHVMCHRMSQKKADSEIEMMQAIAAVLGEMAGRERLL